MAQTESLDQYVSSMFGHIPHTNYKLCNTLEELSLCNIAQNLCISIIKLHWIQEKLLLPSMCLNQHFTPLAFLYQVIIEGSGSHQNRVAESSFQTAVRWARILLLPAAIDCSAVADLKLWLFVLRDFVTFF